MSVTQMTEENLPVPDDGKTNSDVASGDLAQPRSTTEPEVHDDVDRETRIREFAYAAYERRGSDSGSEVDDWLEAERLVNDSGSLDSSEER